MLNREQKDKLKLIVESIDDKLTKEDYIFTARHFDVVMDGMEQLLKQCSVSGSLPPADDRIMFADYIQRCVIERGQMTYLSLKDAIKVWDETTGRFSGNNR